MSLWLVRAGRYGEHESKFIENNRVYLTWAGLSVDMSGIAAYEGIKQLMTSAVIRAAYKNLMHRYHPDKNLGIK
jgi:restriction system protein